MKHMKKATVVMFVMAALLAGLSVTMMHDASGQGKALKKYDYTWLKSPVTKAVKGEKGDIAYTEDMKKLLDQGWRIASIMEGYIVLERER